MHAASMLFLAYVRDAALRLKYAVLCLSLLVCSSPGEHVIIGSAAGTGLGKRLGEPLLPEAARLRQAEDRARSTAG
jgi:hypothetical protein